MADRHEGTGRETTRKAWFPALPPRLQCGEVLDGFRVGDEIARGATGAVYRARSLEKGGSVALKVLSPDLGLLPAAVRRFEKEAELALRARGPGVVPVYRRGFACGHHYYAMELEEGATAREIQGPRRHEAAGTYFQRLAISIAFVARTLDRVHAGGIVHRDVKPENLLLGRDGDLLIGDFGSALGPQDVPSPGEALWGTVRYLSPEQFLPDADPRSPGIDVYALGVTLFEFSTGRLLFPRAPTEQIASWKLTRRTPSAHRINTNVPLSLDAIIRQAVEPSPSDRYASAASLANDLERFATGLRGHHR